MHPVKWAPCTLVTSQAEKGLAARLSPSYFHWYQVPITLQTTNLLIKWLPHVNVTTSSHNEKVATYPFLKLPLGSSIFIAGWT